MDQNIVSKRFVECLHTLKSKGVVRSDREFAQSVNFPPQNLSQIVRGKRDVTIELVRASAMKYNLSLDYIFTGSGEVMKDRSVSGHISGVPYSEVPFIEESREEQYIHSILDSHVDVGRGLYYLGTDDSKDARIFTTKNQGLSPFIEPGAKLVCKRLETGRWDRMVRNHFIYIVVTKEYISVSRVENNLSSDNTITLADGVDVERRISRDEVLEIWEITHVINRWTPSHNFENRTLSEKLETFEDVLDGNVENIKKLNKTLQQLLKQNREQLSMF